VELKSNLKQKKAIEIHIFIRLFVAADLENQSFKESYAMTFKLGIH